jgi:hypothetical protein
MKFLGQVGAYIAGGTSRPTKGWDAPQDHILPVGWAGCPRRDLFANFLFAKRPSWNLPPSGWAGGPRPQASRPISGRKVPIFQNILNRHPFSQFYFFYPFFKKNSEKTISKHGPVYEKEEELVLSARHVRPKYLLLPLIKKVKKIVFKKES